MADYSNSPEYKSHVAKLVKSGHTQSDAQGLADVKFDPKFAKKSPAPSTKRGTSDGYMANGSRNLKVKSVGGTTNFKNLRHGTEEKNKLVAIKK